MRIEACEAGVDLVLQRFELARDCLFFCEILQVSDEHVPRFEKREQAIVFGTFVLEGLIFFPEGIPFPFGAVALRFCGALALKDFGQGFGEGVPMCYALFLEGEELGGFGEFWADVFRVLFGGGLLCEGVFQVVGRCGCCELSGVMFGEGCFGCG